MEPKNAPGNETCQTNNNSIANEHDTPRSRSQCADDAAPRGRAATEQKTWAGNGKLRPSGEWHREDINATRQLVSDGGVPVADSGQGSPDEDPNWDDVSHIVRSSYRQRVAEALVEDPATPSALVERCGDLSMAHASRAVQELRENGLVELLVPEDRRKGRIYGLTDRGKEAIEAADRVATDGGEIDVCPECSSPDTRPLTGGTNTATPEHDYVCAECGHRFDEPERRPPKRDGVAGPTHGGAALLARADSFDEAVALADGRGELPTKAALRERVRDRLDTPDAVAGVRGLRNETLARLADALDVDVQIESTTVAKRRAIRAGVDAIDADDGREFRQADLQAIVGALDVADDGEDEGEGAPAIATDGGRKATRRHCDECDAVRYHQFRDGEWACDTCFVQDDAPEVRCDGGVQECDNCGSPGQFFDDGKQCGCPDCGNTWPVAPDRFVPDGGVERAPGASTPDWGPESRRTDVERERVLASMREHIGALASSDEHYERVDSPRGVDVQLHYQRTFIEIGGEAVESITVATEYDATPFKYVPVGEADSYVALLDDALARVRGGEQA